MNADNDGLPVIADGLAAATDPARLSRNRPSFFADPVGWLVVAAVQDVLTRCPGDVLAAPDQVGVLAMSDTCTAATMGQIAAGAERGRVSPLRFAGASPGLLAGLPCIRWRLRGPALTLTMDPPAAVDVAATVARSWLAGGQASYVLVVAHTVQDGRHVARCVATGGAHRPVTGRRSLRDLLVPAPDELAAGR